MRRCIAVVITGLSIAGAGCADIGSPAEVIPGIPSWLQSRIASYENSPLGSVPSEVWQYQYGGRTVYYIPSPCCDQFNPLYDASGTVICAPDGGFTGRGDGRCTDFHTARTNGVLIWRDTRLPR